MNLRVLISLLLTISVTTVLSQKFIYFPTWSVDSMLSELPEQKGEERINTLNRIAKSLSFINSDSSRIYATQAMNLSNKLNYPEGTAEAFLNFGYIHSFEGNYPKCLKNYQNALKIYDDLDLKRQQAYTYACIGTLNYYASNSEKSIESCLNAINLFRVKNQEGIPIGSATDTMAVYAQLGLYYFLSDSCNKAIDYTIKYLDARNTNSSDITDIFFFHILAGERYSCLGQTDSALLYLNKALNFPDENTNIETLKYRAKSALGFLHFRNGKTGIAIKYFEEALTFYNQKGFLFWASNIAESLGYIYSSIGHHDKAENYYLLSEKVIVEMIDRNSWYRHDSLKHIATWGMELYIPMPTGAIRALMWQNVKSVCFFLYQLNSKKGNTQKALQYHIAYSNASDTLNEIRKSEEILQLQTKFETERYQEEIKNLEQENAIQELRLEQSIYFMIGLGGLVVILIMIALFIIRLTKLRNQQQTLLLQQKLFRSQMNPHFIFNSLTSIQNFIMDAEAHKASKYLSRFSKLIRNILDSSVEEFVPLEEEVSTIENYLELQQIRFKDKFDYSIQMDKKINPENISIPPMLAQPFIENAIEHGLKNKKAKGNIYIRFYSKNNHIVFEVEDDGVGRKKSKEILHQQNKDHKSLGTTITYQRIRVLNKKLKKKITLRILDLKNSDGDSTGTKIVIELPFR